MTLSGGVGAPGVYEIEFGSHLASLVRAAGELSEPARAFLVGGYAGAWIDGSVAMTRRLFGDSVKCDGTWASPAAGLL